MKRLPLLLFALLCTLVPGWSAEPEPSPEADKSWKPIQNAVPVPQLPPEWEKTPPQDKTIVRDRLRAETERLLALGEQARSFAAKFPEDPRRQLARQLAAKALASAERLGSPTARAQLAALDGERLSDPNLPMKDRLEIRMRQVQSEAEAVAQKSPEEARNRFEQGTRTLIAEFPKEPMPYAMLLEVIDQGNDPVTRQKIKELIASQAPAPIKDRAAGVLRRYDALGLPLDLKFTALDGRNVDLADLRGKVVLIHFWATWCEPCVEAIDRMTKAYKGLQGLGVELVGINLDSDKTVVEKFLKEKGVEWPQFWEEAGKNNWVVRKWGVTIFPAVWLVDRKGVLRDLTGETALMQKIQGLLEEEPGAVPPVPEKK